MLGNSYERGERIGNGSNGVVVYKARQKYTERELALKVIPLASDGVLTGLQNKAKIGANLRHQNLVEVVWAELHEHEFHLFMELVSGKKLSERLKTQPQLPIDEALSIFAQMLHGLSHAHKARVIHFDIKPSNTLLTVDDVVKITDFGVSKILRDGMDATKAFAGGTYAYMSPEYFRTDIEFTQFTQRTDLWSVGVVLYEMVAGKRPFTCADRNDPVMWGKVIGEMKYEPLSTLRQDDDRIEKIECLIQCCLQAHDKRFESAQQIIEFLKREKLYVLLMNKQDYEAVRAMQASLNRIGQFLDPRTAEEKRQSPRDIYSLINEWGNANLGNNAVVRDLHKYRVMRNANTHNDTEFDRLAMPPTAQDIAQLENLEAHLTEGTINRYVPSDQPQRISREQLSIDKPSHSGRENIHEENTHPVKVGRGSFCRDYIRVAMRVYENDDELFNFDCPFKLLNLRGISCRVSIVFYDGDGKELAGFKKRENGLYAYRAKSGTLVYEGVIIPQTNEQTYDDFGPDVPLEVVHVPKKGKYGIIRIFEIDSGRLILESWKCDIDEIVDLYVHELSLI